jgi:hypothetical protein
MCLQPSSFQCASAWWLVKTTWWGFAEQRERCDGEPQARRVMS